MIMFLQFVLLLAGLYYAFSVHKTLNTITKEDYVITPSSVANQKNKNKPIEKCKKEKNEPTVEVSDSTKDNTLEETVVVKEKNEIKHKEKIKKVKSDNSKKKEVVNEQNSCEDEELIYLMTLERLQDIENDEEDKEFLKNKIAFEKQLEDSIPDDLCDEEVAVNYSDLFSQENKKKISEEIIQNTNLKWYEQNGNGTSIEQILPQEDFQVEEYDF